ncbi:MAG: succinylglutamate desuccinylase/aspartoacylase family protein [Alphaproteobacteria bacterium]
MTRPRPGDAGGRNAPFEIGGKSVPPGRRAVVEVPISNLSTHTPMTMPVQVVNGHRTGPRLFVSAALHGDEINGVEIIRRMLRDPEIGALHGTLVAIPIVNVFGFVAGSRYLPDRRDLNRSFPGSATGSLAGRLAHVFINEVLARCTHGIDLHTAAIHRDNLPQVRANIDDAAILGMARAFGAPVVINAGERDGSLRQEAARRKIPVIVYEGGEALRFQGDVIRIGARGVRRVMRAIGMLRSRSRTAPPPEPLIARSSAWVRAPGGGILRVEVRLGQHVEADERMGVVADPFGENEVVIKAKTRGIVIGRTNLPVVNAGDALFHIVDTAGTQAAALTLEAVDLSYQASEDRLMFD